MRLFTRIIVEKLHGHWSAWFADDVAVAFGGEWPAQAMFRLLQASGVDRYDEAEGLAVEEATRDGHLEFLIPLRGRVRIPEPSQN